MENKKKKTLGEELLQAVYKNAKMGSDAVTEVIERTKDANLRNELTSQLESYYGFSMAAKNKLMEMNCEAKEPGMLSKLPAELSIKMSTMMDSSDSKIAEIMIGGYNMGIVDLQKNINQAKSEGVPEEAIVEYAKELKPALIVMGTRGAEQKAREIIGSITAEVLDEGRFTVLTVPEPADEENSLHPRNILFFSNLDQNDILAIDTVYRLFGGDVVRVTFMHVPQRRRLMERNAGKALQSLSKYCSENFSHYHFVSVPVSPDDCEQAFASLDSTAHFDLIVSPNRHRNAFSRLFNPGLAHKILFQTDVPMLVIPV